MIHDPHERKCWDCGNIAIHEDRITPWVLCKKCGSQDTRAMSKPTPYPITHIEVPVDELDQLRAAAKELADIKRAWGMCDTRGGA